MVLVMLFLNCFGCIRMIRLNFNFFVVVGERERMCGVDGRLGFLIMYVIFLGCEVS